jgi:enterochelin esterase-like enzyme
MKTKDFVFLGLLLLSWSCKKAEDLEPPPKPADPPLTGSVVTDRIIESQILDGPQHYAIYLPPGYDTASVDYPVLYLLHGATQSYLDWPSHGMSGITDYFILSKTVVPMIIVMPDGFNAYYCNNFDGGDLLYEDYFIDEFIPEIEATYRIMNNGKKRAIAGLSMGGYGATLHAFKRPEMFCCAYSMSGALDPGKECPDLKAIINALSEDQLDSLPAYAMECGTEDVLTIPSNIDFDACLNEKGVTHTYIERSGDHDWDFWMDCLPNAIQLAGEQFNL